MRKFAVSFLASGLLGIAAMYTFGPTQTVSPNSFINSQKPDLVRGKALFDAAGCLACHTDTKQKGKPLVGGRKFKTPFGIYYSPNITPDKTNGIGEWSNADFVRAIRDGLSPSGSHYFPIFPYPSYTGMTDTDILDLKSYLFSLPPDSRKNHAHEIKFPFDWRFSVYFWKLMFFTPGAYQPDNSQSAEWNRGAYLVRHLSHCGECHTPRNVFGGLGLGRELAGTAESPEGGVIPNITPDNETGIGRWSDDEIEDVLTTGGLPNGDFVGDTMAEVVENTTGKLSRNDLAAIILYLKSVPSIHHKIP